MKKLKFSGFIGLDITPATVREALKDTSDVDIDLSSPGGYIFDAIEIFNELKNHPGKKKIVISGLVASAASYIAMAADELIAEDNGVFMIHNPMTFSIGDYQVMEKAAKELERLARHMAKAYISFSGSPAAEIRDMMDAETWLYGQEIVDAGLAHGMVKSTEPDPDRMVAMAAAREKFTALHLVLSKQPEDIHRAVAALPAPPAAGVNNNQEETMTKEQILAAIASMPEMTADEILTAIGEKRVLIEAAVLDKIAAFEQKEKDSKIKAAFGESGPLYDYAVKILAAVAPEGLDAEIQTVRQDTVAKALAAAAADMHSSQNLIQSGRKTPIGGALKI